jgi:hypothetical protein
LSPKVKLGDCEDKFELDALMFVALAAIVDDEEFIM